MSLPLLSQVYDETRRLAIAGSAAAPGDFRLKKLVAPLEQAGQKAPVFARVAQAATRLVESNEASSPEALLELSTLVNAILYTQGETGAAGDLEPLATTDFGEPETQVPARILKPLLVALTTTGSGRLETIKDAAERGAFRDLRLVRHAVAALDDSYPEIGDWIAEHVLPQYGLAIFPELRSAFDLKGRRGDARRLKLMHALDPAQARDVVKQSLDEGSKELKVAAIECLGDADEDLQLLLDLAKARAKEVREAAIVALGKRSDEAAIEVIYSALHGPDDLAAIAAVRISPSQKLQQMVLTEAQSHFSSLLRTKTKDKEELRKLTSHSHRMLECLRDRQDEPAEKFLISLFADYEKLGAIKGLPDEGDVRHRLSSIMAAGTMRCRQALADAHALLEGDDFDLAFLAACSSQPTSAVFKNFSPYYLEKTKKKSRGAAPESRKDLIAGRLAGQMEFFHYYSNLPERFIANDRGRRLKLDDQWLDLAVQQEDLPATMELARPGHKKTGQFLLRAFEERIVKAKTFQEALAVLQTLVRIGHPDSVELFIRLTRALAKSKPNEYGLGWIITQLPKESIPQLEALLPELPEKFAEAFLESIHELKSSP